jgi:hypothetical protein
MKAYLKSFVAQVKAATPTELDRLSKEIFGVVSDDPKGDLLDHVREECYSLGIPVGEVGL